MVLVLRHPDALFFHLEPPASALQWCGDVAAAWAAVAWLGWPLLSFNYFGQVVPRLPLDDTDTGDMCIWVFVVDWYWLICAGICVLLNERC
jgi:hypothetical protein